MKTLADKLGYKTGTPAQLWRVPENFVELLGDIGQGTPPRFHLAFVRHAAELAEAAREVAAGYKPGGHLWIAYPKKSGSIRSDVTRDRGWEPVAGLGLLGVTQVALDADWSALRFRYRDEISRLTRRSERAPGS